MLREAGAARLRDYDVVNLHGPVPTMSDAFLLLSRLTRRQARRAIPPTTATVVPDAEPYFGGSGRNGVLLCHGFTGTPQSVRGWAEHLLDEMRKARVEGADLVDDVGSQLGRVHVELARERQVQLGERFREVRGGAWGSRRAPAGDPEPEQEAAEQGAERRHDRRHLLVAGDREAGSNSLAVRTRNGKDLGAIPVDTIAQRLSEEVASRGRIILEV